MVRRIIEIDQEKCNGCGLCANACHESAIGMIDGKATLLRDDYCDGLGDCLPVCPTNAITFVEREAAAYDEAAVELHIQQREQNACPGSQSQTLRATSCPGSQSRTLQTNSCSTATAVPSLSSQLRQWPVQIQLAPIQAPYFDGAKLLIAADCTAYAYANFHNDFIKGKITLVGCPKLDMVDYSEKLTEILKQNNIHSLTVVRMEVPCCGGIEMAVRKALQNSNKLIPWQVVTISTDGRILDQT